ncbi:hypothetical protein FEM48_Zijuj02G0096400 [Ziziphus jujuba var. spinosa]|uniref:Protein FAR1-RELATED SEQUENCE n=1 Tax=Ziziphus jujuba var. spinosa TaxID=714518 RepID=A0A978VV03_ZIZJJ|nr:hypothetical protein FEM48_Zijuj02G0096400 [Ziziphus jujuba var. spinosa]
MENTTDVGDLKDIEKPKVGMLFDSIDELKEYYKMYGKKNRFEICKRTSSKEDDEELKYITFACSHQGKSRRKSKDTFRLHPVRKTGCLARFTAAICSNERLNLKIGGVGLLPCLHYKPMTDYLGCIMRDKVEKENHEDLISFNSWILCISRYDIEKQYQSVYTTAKFKEFQQELAGKLYCELLSNKEVVVNSYQFVVNEDVMIGQSSRRISFIVCFKEEKSKVTCNYRLFEFRGILCRHAIVMLIHKKINCILDVYILRRWRKDVKICYTKVKISYIDLTRMPEVCRFDKMCKSFCKVADLTTDSDDTCNLVMDLIYDMKKKLTMKLPMNECSSICDETISSFEHNNVSNKSGGKVLTSRIVRSKSYPPFKKKQSKVGQIKSKRMTLEANSIVVMDEKSLPYYNFETFKTQESTMLKV